MTSSTTICFEKSGITLTETRALSTAANSFSLFTSESETLPSSAPTFGQNESLMSPSSFSVRFFFSFTSWMIWGL